MFKFSSSSVSLTCLTVLISAQVQAETEDEQLDSRPSTQFFEVSYTEYINHGNTQYDFGDLRGLALSGSFDIAENWYIPIYYERLNEDYYRVDFVAQDNRRRNFTSTFDSDLEQYSVGIGYRLDFSEQAIMTFDFSFVRENTDIQLGTSSSSAETNDILRDRNIPVGDERIYINRTNHKHRIGVSYQHKFNDQWQAGIRADFATEDLSDVGNYEGSVSGELLYFYNKDWAVVGRLETGNVKRQTIGVRYSF